MPAICNVVLKILEFVLVIVLVLGWLLEGFGSSFVESADLAEDPGQQVDLAEPN
jgi:hypothetical protein